MRHGRDGGRLSHARRAHPRGRRCDRRRSCSPRAGRRASARPSSSPSSTGARCSSTRSTRCSPCRRSTAVVVVLGARRRGVRGRASTSRGAEPVVCERLGGGHGGLAALRASRPLGDCDWVVVTLGDQPRVTPQVDRGASWTAPRRAGRHAAVRATYDGAPGHPVAPRPRAARRAWRAAAATRAPATCSAAPREDVRGGAPVRPGATSTRPRSWRRCAHEARAVVRGRRPARAGLGRR